MTPGELMETELRIAYIDALDRLQSEREISSFWRDLAQHYAGRLDAMDIRRDPLHDLFPSSRGAGESAALSSYPPYPAGSPVPSISRNA